jgi:putative flippase GtrA
VNRAGAGRLRLYRFQLVGLMGAAVQLGSLAILTSHLGVETLVSTAIAVEAAVIHNFVWHERWTWADRIGGGATLRRRLKRFCQFNASTGFFSIGLNILLTYFAMQMIGARYLLANVFAIAVASLFNFLVSELIVFRAVELKFDPARSGKQREPMEYHER